MNVLITGATGHVGVNLIKTLSDRGHHIRALIHDSSLPPDGDNIKVVPGDVCDFDSILNACKNIDIVYHLAARISIGAESWKTLEKVNVAGTRNVVEACLQSGVGRLMHFSSIHAIVQKPLDTPIDESRALVGPQSHPAYDRSKAAGEEKVWRGIRMGLNAVIISPTAIIGPNDFRSSYFGEAFQAIAAEKLPALVGGGFDWVDVRDVAEGAVLAAEKAPAGAKYLLSGHWVSVKDLAMIISELTGTQCPWFVCPMWIASGVAPLADAYARITNKRTLFTGESMRALRTCNHHVSHEKATRELGYHPRPFRETVKDTLEWYNANSKVKQPIAEMAGISK